jgi:HSP20 family molecular chaperone IbpA
MKTFFQNKIVIGVLCFALGLGAMYGAHVFWLKPKPVLSDSISVGPRNMDSLFDQFYNDDFFGRSRDPFEEMRRMRERMLKQFDHPDQGGGLFDSWYRKKLGGGEVGDTTKREDDHFVYYDIAIKGLDQNKVSVKVENGRVQISGQIEKRSQDENAGSFFSSSFHRSFPAPSDVDPNKVQMEQEQDKLVVKFSKVEAST